MDLFNLCCCVCSKVVYFTSLRVSTSPVLFDNCTYDEIGHSTKLHISFHNISTLIFVCVCVCGAFLKLTLFLSVSLFCALVTEE